MHQLIVIDHFDAAHKLLGHSGKCAVLHGHTWKVEACFQAQGLDRIGISVDFRILKGVLRYVLEEFDHVNLSELRYFKVINPTAENMSALLFDKIKERLCEDENAKVCKLVEVRLWESQNTCCVFSE